VPERVSQLIEPMMSAHFGRLSKETMRKHAFGLFDMKNKSLHFYAPKYDANDIRRLGINPMFYSTVLQDTNTMYVRVRSHQLFEGDMLNITGATDVGLISASAINGMRRVVGIVNEDMILIEIGATIPVGRFGTGGGENLYIQPQNDESIGYLYHYIPSLRINAWSRLRGIKLNAGCVSVEGRAFFADDENILRYGSIDAPVYGDYIGNFNRIWTTGGGPATYSAGDLVQDTVSRQSYRCLVTYNATQLSTFAMERENFPDNWELYMGEPINMEWELPWADFDSRMNTKALKHIHLDADGTAQFTVSAFVDKIYRDAARGQLQPLRSMQFTAGDSAGFGAGSQPFGGGRRTREQYLWNYPIRFKMLKLRVTASTVQPLRISSVSFLYHEGSLIKT
jgi:hypothetical protein